MIAAKPRPDLWAAVAHLDLGAVRVSVLSVPPARTPHSASPVPLPDPEYPEHCALALTLVTQGAVGLYGRKGASRLAPGDFLLCDTSRPSAAWALAEHGPARLIVVRLPPSGLALAEDRVAEMLGQRLPGDSCAGSVLASFLETLVAQAEAWAPRDAVRLGSVVLDLATVFIGRQLAVPDPLPAAGRQAALLRRIHTFIEHHLTDPRLGPSAIAEAHHISVRQLHRIFATQETSPGAWIRRRRLEHCRSELADARYAAQTIAWIAARWGFLHPADFSRAFRSAFGTTPRQWRRAAGLAVSVPARAGERRAADDHQAGGRADVLVVDHVGAVARARVDVLGLGVVVAVTDPEVVADAAVVLPRPHRTTGGAVAQSQGGGVVPVIDHVEVPHIL